MVLRFSTVICSFMLYLYNMHKHGCNEKSIFIASRIHYTGERCRLLWPWNLDWNGTLQGSHGSGVVTGRVIANWIAQKGHQYYGVLTFPITIFSWFLLAFLVLLCCSEFCFFWSRFGCMSVCDCLDGYYDNLIFDPYEFVCATLLSPVNRLSFFWATRPEMPVIYSRRSR